MSEYYAYVHARPSTLDASGIFYVGKGSGRRAYSFNRRAQNPYYANVVEKNGSPLIGKLECSSEAIAFELERGLIKCLRKMGVKLTNLSDGGEGQSGYKFSEEFKANHYSKSAEYRKKASENTRIQFSKPGAKDHLIGENNQAKRPEIRAKMIASAALAVKEGRHNSVANNPLKTDEGRQKVKASHQKRKLEGTHHLLLNNPSKTPEIRERRRLSFLGDNNPMRNPLVIAKRINPSSIPEVAKARGLKLKGRICVNNGERYIRVAPEELDRLLAEGWKRGRI